MLAVALIILQQLSQIQVYTCPEAASSPKAKGHYTPSSKKALRVLTINFQSIRKKGRNIDVLVETIKPDVILDTETWLSEDIPFSYFFNPSLGYKVIRRGRSYYPHGGVLLAVKDDTSRTQGV